MRRVLVGLVALVCVSAAACTTSGDAESAIDPGTGQMVAAPAVLRHTDQCWTLGDSRGKGSTTPPVFTGWGSWLVVLGCKNLSESGTGFSVQGYDGTTIPELFAASVALRGLPAKVYVSGDVNDALKGIDASAAIVAFHKRLADLGVQQVWGTAPYTSGTTRAFAAANLLVAKMNAAMPWAKNCAGPNPNRNTFDGIHQDGGTFAACIMK
jgi:hypothetical protein